MRKNDFILREFVKHVLEEERPYGRSGDAVKDLVDVINFALENYPGASDDISLYLEAASDDLGIPPEDAWNLAVEEGKLDGPRIDQLKRTAIKNLTS